MTSNFNSEDEYPDGVVLQGYHKKLKTMKKKYFVLCADKDTTNSARLEYYDSEKKFKSKSNSKPKRIIKLKNCFNINRRLDTKHKYVIALSTKDEGFCIVLDTEHEMNKWLRELLILQRGEDTEEDSPRPNFEHVWQVQVQRKGLAEEKGIIGTYHACLTAKSLTLLLIGPEITISGEHRVSHIEFYLTTVRRCGDSHCYFYMEVGRHSVIGAGELWMETEEPLIAQNMHKMILTAMTSKNRDDSIGPMRKRSSSANEASKPISVLQRRQTHSGNKTINSSPLSESPGATSSTVSSSTSTVIMADDDHPVAYSTPCKLNQQQQPSPPDSSSSEPLDLQMDAANINHSNSLTSSSSQPNDTKYPQNPAISAINATAIANSTATRFSTSLITSTSTNPHYPFAAPLRSYIGSQRRHSVSALSAICHQRALSLPIGETYVTNSDTNNQMVGTCNTTTSTNNNIIITQQQQLQPQPPQQPPPLLLLSTTSQSSSINNNNSSNSKINRLLHHTINGGCLKPVHQRTRSLPLTEETAILCNQLTPQTTTLLMKPIAATTNVGQSQNGIAINVVCSCRTQYTMLCTLNNNPSTATTTNQKGSASSNNNCSMLLGSQSGNCSHFGTALGRERCDSLPSARNRTISECSNHSITNSSMPPPRTIPSFANRTHSVYNRHSHSPPMNALSPSTGCSESEGSSLSIDETDSYGHSLTPDESGNFASRFYNSDRVIPEENSDDFYYGENNKIVENNKLDNKLNNHHNNSSGGFTLPISTNHHQQHTIGRSGDTQTTPYMDICSPYSPCCHSPCDQVGTGGYMPISPCVEYPPKSGYTGSSGGHSRASSLAEETVDGYVPMGGPIQSTGDYVDMEQSMKQQQQLNSAALSSAASTCSITSGSQSTDMRFSEFPLEKVTSRFTPDDEEMLLAGERPTRAYSVGSRSEHNKRKLRTEILTHTEQNNSRVRAYSVGSRAKVPRCDLARFTPSLVACNINNNIINADASLLSSSAGSKGKKSSSAPILVHKSQSSVDRMGDLMEIDFSKNSDRSDSHSDSLASPTTRVSSFPVTVPFSRPRCDTFGSSPRTTTAPSGYMEMKPGSFSDKASPKMATSISKSSDNGYLEMRPIAYSNSQNLSSSPLKSMTMSSPKTSGDYITMSPSSVSSSTVSSSRAPSRNANVVVVGRLATSIEKPMEIQSGTPEGYMEMSWGNKKSLAHTASESKQSKDAKNNAWSAVGGANRSPSMPIDIKSNNTTKDNNCLLYDLISTRANTNDLPTPLATTAANQSTQFLFSPSSPVKGMAVANDFTQRKCMVDASSGTVTILPQTTTSSSLDCKILNTDQPSKTFEKVDALTNHYADLSLGTTTTTTKKKPNVPTTDSDYVNYNPGVVKAKNSPIVRKNSTSNEDGDYAVMNPSLTKATTLVTAATSSPYGSFYGNRITHSFKPISSNSNDDCIFVPQSRKSTSPKSSAAALNRNEKVRKVDDSSAGYELIHNRSDSALQTKRLTLSRPNSVNSDKISPLKGGAGSNSTSAHSRPNSANSDCIQTISASSSTSTLCGSSSSSSTLCGSKSQSPLANSRPQSISDTLIGTTQTDCDPIAAAAAAASRPPSVSSERELHYARLDLPPTTTTSTSATKANNNNNCSSSTTSGDSSTSPSPNSSNLQHQPTFTYAKIDFNKCENLKLAMNSVDAAAATPSAAAVQGNQ